jgi:ribosome-associated translation inhibitor RaiA
MQVLVHTDRHIKGKENLMRELESQVTSTLDRYSDKITRVELYVADENAHKAGADDIRCTLEARVSGVPPVVVNERTDQLLSAVQGALSKMESSLETLFGKHKSKRVRSGEDAEAMLSDAVLREGDPNEGLEYDFDDLTLSKGERKVLLH